jgi:hypothetical protein
MREDHLRRAAVENTGCQNCKRILMLGNKRQRKPNTSQSGGNSLYIPDNTDDTFLSLIVKDPKDSSSDPATGLPENPPVSSKCSHGVYLTPDEREAGHGIAGNCGLCTPAVVRNADFTPSKRALSVRGWDLKLKHENLDMNRGMSLSDVDGSPAGKNTVTGGLGSHEIEFTDNRDATIRGYGGRRRTAAGRDKVAPGQDPRRYTDFDGTADPSDVPHATTVPSQLVFDTLASSSLTFKYEIRKTVDKTYDVLENGAAISTHKTRRDAQALVAVLKAEQKAQLLEEVVEARPESETQVPEDDIDRLVGDEEAIEKGEDDE